MKQFVVFRVEKHLSLNQKIQRILKFELTKDFMQLRLDISLGPNQCFGLNRLNWTKTREKRSRRTNIEKLAVINTIFIHSTLCQ